MKVAEARERLLDAYGERFVRNIDFSRGDDACWLWTAYANPAGYGQFNVAPGVNRYSHRMAFSALCEEIKPPMVVDHDRHCIRRCLQPSHLRQATNAQNTQNRNGATTRSRLGVRGVWRDKNRFRAIVWKDGKHHCGGTYSTIEEAEAVASRMRDELFGPEWAGRSRALKRTA